VCATEALLEIRVRDGVGRPALDTAPGLEAHKLRSTLIDSVIATVEQHIDRVDLSQVGVSDVEWTTGRAREASGKAQVAASAPETVA